MSDADSHRIRTAEQLRAVVGPTLRGIESKVHDHVDEFARDFLARSPFLVLATAAADGRLDASPKGDAPGFVWVEDERTIVIPDRPGNKLVYGHLNILENPRVGVVCVIPGTPETLRINGTAELSVDPALIERLAARGRPAVLGIRVHVEECFFHCGKAFLRSQLWKPESWGERHKVSFGRMLAKQVGGDDALAGAVDAAIETDYRDGL